MSLTAKLVLSPLLVAQALFARRRIPHLPEPAGARQGVVGEGARELKLLVTGDSSAAGVGVVHQRDGFAHQLAGEIASMCGVRVCWRLHARSGLNTAQTLALLRQEPIEPFDLAVVVSGVNDVVDQVPSHHAVVMREHLTNWLRNALGVWHVVFAPLPPVHRFHGLPQPLRWVAGSDARRHDRALAHWAATRSDVSRAEVELPFNRGVMASDGFHPGRAAYRLVAHGVAEHVAQRVWPLMAAPLGENAPPRGDPA
jgi:lysophospholipase L1-like esterase